MTKNEKFKMRLKGSLYQFSKEDYVLALRELRMAGDMVLAEIKKMEEREIKKKNEKLPM